MGKALALFIHQETAPYSAKGAGVLLHIRSILSTFDVVYSTSVEGGHFSSVISASLPRLYTRMLSLLSTACRCHSILRHIPVRQRPCPVPPCPTRMQKRLFRKSLVKKRRPSSLTTSHLAISQTLAQSVRRSDRAPIASTAGTRSRTTASAFDPYSGVGSRASSTWMRDCYTRF